MYLVDWILDLPEELTVNIWNQQTLPVADLMEFRTCNSHNSRTLQVSGSISFLVALITIYRPMTGSRSLHISRLLRLSPLTEAPRAGRRLTLTQNALVMRW